MALVQPNTVITQGLGGASWLLITQGYGPPKAISLILTVDSPLVTPSALDGVHTNNIACNWSVSGGILAIAGDSKSGIWTLPATPGTYTITATDKTDPGNTQTATVTVYAISGTTVETSGLNWLSHGVTRKL